VAAAEGVCKNREKVLAKNTNQIEVILYQLIMGMFEI